MTTIADMMLDGHINSSCQEYQAAELVGNGDVVEQ